MTLVITNAALTLLFAAAGYLAVRRMVAPMRVLSDHLADSTEGEAEPITEARMPARGTEARGLFEAFNRLAESQRQSRALGQRLAEEERIGSLGRLTSGLAHEINNPLGGLFNAVDMLKRHGDDAVARGPALDLIERGLTHIRDVVAAALQTYRPERSPRAFGPADLDDVRLLAAPEFRRRRVALSWDSTLDAPVDLPGAPVRQALLNLVLNAVGAAPEGSRVRVEILRDAGWLRVCVCDEGGGLPASAADLLTTPEATAPIGAGDGLGLWVVRRIVSDLDGTITCDRCAAGGARIRLAMPLAPTTIPKEAVDALA